MPRRAPRHAIRRQEPEGRLQDLLGAQLLHASVMTLGADRFLTGPAWHGAKQMNGLGMVRTSPGDMRGTEQGDDRGAERRGKVAGAGGRGGEQTPAAGAGPRGAQAARPG